MFSIYFDVLIKDLMPFYICRFCLNITWGLEWCRALVFKENKYKVKPWLLLFCYNKLDMHTSVYLTRMLSFNAEHYITHSSSLLGISGYGFSFEKFQKQNAY